MKYGFKDRDEERSLGGGHRGHSRGSGRGQGRGGSGGGRGRGQGKSGFGPDSGRGGGNRRHGGVRARRGEIRAAVLALLSERSMHGYEMIKEIEERTEGLWKPSPGSVYPTLSLLEDEGHVSADEDGGRRRFTLTETGAEEARQSAGDRTPWEAVVGGVSTVDQSLRQVARQIMVAAKQVGEAGNSEAKTQAVQVLNETRKKLYGILAEAE